MEYLIVAATEAEAAYVPTGFEVLLTGVGKTAAAVATTRALVRRDPADVTVINIGSVGALRDGLAGLYLPGTVINHDISAELIRAIGLDPADTLPVPGGDEIVLASGDVFVADPVVRDRLAQRAHLVDMEGYAVVYACRQLGVPVRLVKHVSDAADEGALQWETLVDKSAAALGEWLATLSR